MKTEQNGKPRVGVYICHCGGNISDVVDVQRVTESTASLPGVVIARNEMFMCSDPGQNLIIEDIQKEGLDKIVVAACSPSLHESTFRRTLTRAGLNPYVYENVNIREHVSWATCDPEEATAKAVALVRAGVAKASRLHSLEPVQVATTKRVAVVGGGVAGLRAARDLAEAGIEVSLIERKATLGGNVSVLDRLFPSEEPAADLLTRLEQEVDSHPRVTVHLGAEVERAEGYVGNFTLTVRQQAGAHGAGSPAPVSTAGVQLHEGAEDFVSPIAAGATTFTVDVGAIVVATGFEPYQPAEDEYGYGRLPQVVTLPDFIKWLSQTETGTKAPQMDGRPIRSVAFIHCVGSRQIKGVNQPGPDGNINEYCSRVCCTATLHAICELREKHPSVAVCDFHQDIRTYGHGHEDYYERASQPGVVFVRFVAEQPPTVLEAQPHDDAPVLVRCKDQLTLEEEIEAAVDLVVLAVGMLPADASTLIDSLKLPVGTDHFLLEIHPKLRPVELAVHGVFLAGTSQGPKNTTETCATASAAAAKATALLSEGHVDLDPFVAHVDSQKCEGHGHCLEQCEYAGAISLQDYPDGHKRAVINPALCAGCGACVAVCPSRAIDIGGWTLDQYDAMVDALLIDEEVPVR